MQILKSPGGSTFPYYYKGGEIHCLKYGSYFSDTTALFQVMQAEEDFIKSLNRRLRIWVDFYETSLPDNVLAAFLTHIHSISDSTLKLSIVGCSWFNQWRLKRLAKQRKLNWAAVRYFKDPEDAKTWLVSE